MRLLLPLLLFALLGLLPSAFAYNAPGSAVLLDFHADRVAAELRLPLSELELSFREPLEVEPATIVAQFHERLVDYVRQHVTPRSPDERAWSVKVLDIHVALTEQPIDLVVQLELRPPSGTPTRRFTLNYDVISHEVINHITVVSVRRDWNHAVFPDRRELLAPLRFFSKSLTIDRTGGSPMDWPPQSAGGGRRGTCGSYPRPRPLTARHDHPNDPRMLEVGRALRARLLLGFDSVYRSP